MPGNRPELLSKFASLRGEFGTYHSNVDRNRKFYERNFEDEVLPTDDDSVWAYMPPSARRAIDDPSDHILTMPKIRVPVRPTDADPVNQERIAEKKRQFINSWWRNITDRSNPMGDGRKLMLLEGRLCLRKSLRWDMVPDYPDKSNYKTRQQYRTARRRFQKSMDKIGHYEFLWDVEVLDTKTVFEDPNDHRNPMYVFVEHEVFCEEAKRLFPGEIDESLSGNWRSRNDYQTLRYIEYWSRPTYKFDGTWEPGEHVQWIEDNLVKSEDNPYPYIPIAIEDAGYGRVYKGAKPHEKYVGIAQHTLETFVAQARQYTSWQNVTEMSAFPAITTRNMDATKPLVIGPKRVIPLEGGPDDPNREAIEFVAWPPLPIEVIQLAARTDQIVDETVKMNALGGQAIKGVETATEADQQIRNAASKLDGPVAGCERLAGRLTSWVLMDIDSVLEAPVTVFGTGDEGSSDEFVTLGPKDIDGFYRVSAVMTTTDEYEASLNKARFWLDAYQRSPFLSAITALTKGEVTDEPMQEMILRAAEDVFLSEEMVGIRKLSAAQAFGAFAQMFQQMVAGGGGDGATPGSPTGGSVTPAQPNDRRMNTFNRALESRDAQMSAGAYRAT